MNNQPLPPGFISQWDPNYQRYFYVNTATGKSQWEDPRIQAPPGPPPPDNKYGSPINQSNPPPYNASLQPNQVPNRQPSPQPYQQPYNQPSPQPYPNQPSPQPYPNQPYRQPSPQPYAQQPAPPPKQGMNPMTAGLAGLAGGAVGGFLLGELVEKEKEKSNVVEEVIVENNGWGRNNVVEEVFVENNGWGGRDRVEEVFIDNNNGNVVEEIIYENNDW
ncbi:hypothetical protein HDV06_005800 [Boothiomyces sp. JEL0866]|nr:hypothetical protein HDV06_005800 [Boothiomyces sp. JEL0866]